MGELLFLFPDAGFLATTEPRPPPPPRTGTEVVHQLLFFRSPGPVSQWRCRGLCQSLPRCSGRQIRAQGTGLCQAPGCPLPTVLFHARRPGGCPDHSPVTAASSPHSAPLPATVRPILLSPLPWQSQRGHRWPQGNAKGGLVQVRFFLGGRVLCWPRKPLAGSGRWASLSPEDSGLVSTWTLLRPHTPPLQRPPPFLQDKML